MGKKRVKKANKALIAIGRLMFSQFVMASKGCCCRRSTCPCCRKDANLHPYTHGTDCPVGVVLEEDETEVLRV